MKKLLSLLSILLIACGSPKMLESKVEEKTPQVNPISKSTFAESGAS